MFSYYGAKTKIVQYYPGPKYSGIIEPFAGSARYALRYYDRDVLIADIDPTICGIWKWLVEEATVKDIEKLPRLNLGDDLRKFKFLSSVERDLLGFVCNMGTATPKNVVTLRAARNDLPRGSPKWGPNNEIDRLKIRLRHYLPRIRHWRVLNCSYEKLKINPEATWFVDPPYNCKAGQCYKHHDIDYSYLATWCKSRRGQIIVCENADATWLDFKPLKIHSVGSYGSIVVKTSSTMYNKNREGIWTNDPAFSRY